MLLFVLGATGWVKPEAVKFEGERVVLRNGFERGLQGWNFSGLRPLDRSTRVWGNVKLTKEGAHRGEACLKIVKSGALISPLIPYQGERVKVSFYMRLSGVRRGDKPWKKAGAQVLIFDERGRQLKFHWGHYNVALEEGTHGWLRYSRRFVLPDAVRAIRISLTMRDCSKGEAWFDDLEVSLSPPMSPLPTARLTIDLKRPLGRWRNIVEGIDAGPAERVRFPAYKEAMSEVVKMGFRYLRLHNPLECVKVELTDGRLLCDWSFLDRLIESVLKVGLKPLLIIEGMPPVLASKPKRRWYFNCPPKDYELWRALVREWVRHLQERFGAKEVRGWPFEVWNEPWAPAYFDGTYEDYLRLYEHTAAGIWDADPRIKVGADPDSGEFLLKFVRHCSRGSRVDFLSRHLYAGRGYGEAFPMVRRIVLELRRTRKTLSHHPSLDRLPLYITEWNCVTSPRAYADSEYNAVFVLRSLKAFLDEGGVDKLFFFCLVDHVYKENLMFDGHLGMFTVAGVPKPVYAAFLSLSRLRGKRVKVEGGDEFTDGLATLDESGAVAAIVWTGSEDPKEPPLPPRRVTLKFVGLKEGRYLLQRFSIDRSHSNALDDWRALGSPRRPSPEEILLLKAAANLEEVERMEIKARGKTLKIEFHAPSPSVSLLLLSPTKV